MQRSGAAHPGVDPRLVDGVLAVGMTLAVAVLIVAELEGTVRTGPGAYLFAAGFGALMLLRRRFPVVVLALTVLGIFVYYVFGFPPIGIALPAVAALYSAAELDRTRAAVGAGLVLVAVSAYYRIEEGQPASYLYGYELLTNVALVAAAVALGVAVRLGRESRARAEQLRLLTAAEQARVVEARLQAERMRIARDLHDAVGHTMSVISVHSGVAAEAIGRDDDVARQALERVRDATSATMRELRATVKVLRNPAAEGSERGTGGLAGVEDLARAAREAGLKVDVDVQVPPGVLDGAIDAAAYRIVQESLTNVLRHASARRAAVVARIEEGRLHLGVSDDGGGTGRRPTSAVEVPGGGRGIPGMRERAALLGGRLEAGDGAGGGFAVVAELPVRLGP
jgi:signal transduction histidine kinase